MSWFYRNLIRPVLFTQNSEKIHNRTLAALEWISHREFCCDLLSSFFSVPNLPVEAFGLSFPNPVGLAAGMDKHAAAAPKEEPKPATPPVITKTPQVPPNKP